MRIIKRMINIFCLAAFFLLLSGLHMDINAASEYTDVTIDIPVSISGKGVPVSESHIIRMTAEDGSFPMPGGKTGGSYDLKVNGDGNAAFPAIRYTRPWHYSYTVTQIAGSHALSVSYDKSLYHLEVDVYNKGGRLITNAAMSKEGTRGKTDVAAFTNVYVLPAVVEDDPKVKVKVSGDRRVGDSFTFTMVPYSNTAGLPVDKMPMPEGSSRGSKSVTLGKGEMDGFGKIVFSAPGDYVYRVTQSGNGTAGYKYDNAVYTITYHVSRQGDRLVYTYDVKKNGKDSVIEFVNKYSRPKASFSPLKIRQARQTQNTMPLKWSKVPGAKKYVLYGNFCNYKGKINRIKKIKTVKTNKLTLKKIFGKKIRKGRYYKFYVKALDKHNNVIAVSRVIHVCTKGGKYSNHKRVRIISPRLRRVVLKAGKIKKIKAKAIGKRVHVHIGLCYESSNKKIATVNKKGKIKAISPGKCKIFVYAQNGKYSTVYVTVK